MPDLISKIEKWEVIDVFKFEADVHCAGITQEREKERKRERKKERKKEREKERKRER